MRNRYALVAILVLFALAAGATASQAGRPVAVPGTPFEAPQGIEVGKPGPSVLTPVCRLGVTADPHLTMNYFYPPDDEYYTLIDPSACGCAGAQGVAVTAAHVILDFPEACTLPVTVAVVAADLTDPSCPAPVREQYLCPPTDFDLEVSNAGGYDFLMPLGGACCVTQKAFLLIKVRELGTCGAVPSLYVTFGCDPCTSWNYWPGGALTDLCEGYLLGNPNMYVDAACCSAVPTLPRTWGQLKSTYR